MATHSIISREDLICPQCTDIYCFPVLLLCGHNVCKLCLQKFWEWKGCQECPVCKVVSIPKRPPINLALKIAADKYHQEKAKMSVERCSLHEEKLTVYCQNDEKPICLLCQMSKLHKVHECCPLDEAAKQKKEDITGRLETLKKKLQTLDKTRESWERTRTFIQRQADENNRTIREEFQKLHKFLFEEENSRLQVLAQEVEVKVKVMSLKLDFMEKQIKSLSSVISNTEKRLEGDDLSFLLDYNDTKKKLKCNFKEPEIIRDILINSATHLASLKFHVWRKMEHLVKYVPITLDPNTAQANLELSEELSCMQYSSQRALPDNPERCTGGVCVLGAGGFVSGKHSWTVDVSRGKDWYIGVVRESIQRKGAMSLKPSDGVWIIGGMIGDVLWAQTSPRTRLEWKQKAERITVELDYDKGKVAFINAADSKSIFTFKDKFTERIFPYFSVGIHEEGSGSFPLAICSQNITLTVSDK
ncbi:zinc-binding protein A33-like isoform X2 [Corythoichthys intestinalis]|uniref:zinc-binding protein A33-like isoform X2 n=1 Tax=Corythoichthys intestinalis TaxID=161448 RepID=UPI0025A68E4E|nr:zinc-binding protein A33-like isoform X2 [Corythoichthys intestinalis]XP_061812342.1 zinc-binding protein A33-like [Nerophis lumbriciformis]